MYAREYILRIKHVMQNSQNIGEGVALILITCGMSVFIREY